MVGKVLKNGGLVFGRGLAREVGWLRQGFVGWAELTPTARKKSLSWVIKVQILVERGSMTVGSG